jgi:hypothetical protein
MARSDGECGRAGGEHAAGAVAHASRHARPAHRARCREFDRRPLFERTAHIAALGHTHGRTALTGLGGELFRSFRLLGRRTGTHRDNQILDAAVAHVLGMGMTLGAEADDGDLLVLDQIEIGIPIIINAHQSTPGGF